MLDLDHDEKECVRREFSAAMARIFAWSEPWFEAIREKKPHDKPRQEEVASIRMLAVWINTAVDCIAIKTAPMDLVKWAGEEVLNALDQDGQDIVLHADAIISALPHELTYEHAQNIDLAEYQP